MKIASIILIKNEKNYLEDFIKYHTILGVDKFFIYDDNSTDDYSQILDKYTNIVSYFKFNRFDDNGNLLKKKRWYHYKHFYENYSSNYDWLLNTDIDEYLECDNLKIFIKNCEIKNIKNIAIPFYDYLPIKDENLNIVSPLQFFKKIPNHTNHYKCLCKINQIVFKNIHTNHYLNSPNDYYLSDYNKYQEKKITAENETGTLFFYIYTDVKNINTFPLYGHHFRYRNFQNKINNYKNHKSNFCKSFYQQNTYNQLVNCSNFVYNCEFRKIYIKKIYNFNVYNIQQAKDNNINYPDIYLTPEYGKACEESDKGKWELCIYKDLMFCYLKKLDENKIITPYGYSEIYYKNINILDEFKNKFNQYLKDLNIKEIIIRKNLYLDNK